MENNKYKNITNINKITKQGKEGSKCIPNRLLIESWAEFYWEAAQKKFQMFKIARIYLGTKFGALFSLVKIYDGDKINFDVHI